MPNRWITFVKQWASSNNIAYGCALSKPEMKAAYHKEYPKAIKLPKGVRPPADVKSKMTFRNLAIRIPEDNEADDNDYDSQADTVVMDDDEVSFVPAEPKKKAAKKAEKVAAPVATPVRPPIIKIADVKRKKEYKRGMYGVIPATPQKKDALIDTPPGKTQITKQALDFFKNLYERVVNTVRHMEKEYPDEMRKMTNDDKEALILYGEIYQIIRFEKHWKVPRYWEMAINERAKRLDNDWIRRMKNIVERKIISKKMLDYFKYGTDVNLPQIEWVSNPIEWIMGHLDYYEYDKVNNEKAAPVEPVAAPVEPVAAPVEPEKKKIYKEAKFKEILKMPERYANWFNNTFVKEFKAKSTKEQKKEVKEATIQAIKNFIRKFEGRVYGSPHETSVEGLYNFIKQTKTVPLGLLDEIAVSDADITQADKYTRESERHKMRYIIRAEPAFRLFVMANKILPITDRDTKKLLSDIGVRVVNQKAGVQLNELGYD